MAVQNIKSRLTSHRSGDLKTAAVERWLLKLHELILIQINKTRGRKRAVSDTSKIHSMVAPATKTRLHNNGKRNNSNSHLHILNVEEPLTAEQRMDGPVTGGILVGHVNNNKTDRLVSQALLSSPL